MLVRASELSTCARPVLDRAGNWLRRSSDVYCAGSSLPTQPGTTDRARRQIGAARVEERDQDVGEHVAGELVQIGTIEAGSTMPTSTRCGEERNRSVCVKKRSASDTVKRPQKGRLSIRRLAIDSAGGGSSRGRAVLLIVEQQS